MVYDPLEELKATLADRYTITREAGKGGMATVYLAEDVKHKRQVAIKVLSPDLSYTIGAERFTREIHTAARLQHPHILPVFDSGEAGGLLYYVMPFVEGESLRDRLERDKQLPVEDALHIVIEVAGALGYAHAKGVVHRDIKPENILMEHGHALVADFGIAHAKQDSGEKLTGTGMSVGTAQYMAPEQFAGNQADARSDVYSLGCVLYELLVGEVPFNGPNMMAIMARHTMEHVPSVRIVRNTVPEEVEEAVYRAMEKTPADRFQSMDEFRAALTGGAGGATGTYPRHTSRFTARHRVPDAAPAPATRAWSRGRVALAAAAVVLLAGLGIAAASLLDRGSRATVTNADKVAVLYFDDQSGTDSLGYLGDALAEALIDQLTGIPGLEVVTRSGVEPFRGQPVDSVRAIAAALGVGSIVRGTVRPGDAGGVQVRVALLDASGDELEGQTFRHSSAQLLGLRDSVTKEVGEFLRNRLGQRITVQTSRSRTSNIDAWVLTQRAERRRKDADRMFANDSASAGLAALVQADSLLQAAEQLDPRWADAPAYRARIALRQLAALRTDRAAARAAFDSGMAHANRALDIDPRHADALEMRGALRWIRIPLRLIDERAIAAALDSAEKDLLAAVQVRPTQATAWSTLSNLYYRKPDVAEAKNAAMNAYKADAYLAATEEILRRLFWTNYDQELFAEAQRWCVQEGHRRFPANPFFYECQLWMQTAPKGVRYDPDLARTLRDSLVKYASPATRGFLGKRGDILVAGALARAGLADSARKVLLAAREGARQVDPERELVGDEAVIRVILGDRAEAVKLIKDYLTYFPDHRGGFASGTGWWWRDLQTDPEFRRLVQASG